MEPCSSPGSTVVVVTNGRWFQKKNDSDGTSDVFTVSLHLHMDPLSILMLDLEGKLLAQALKFTFGSWRLGHLGTNKQWRNKKLALKFRDFRSV